VLAASAQARCSDHGVSVQVLGSGGPDANDARASAGNLVWIDGHARVLVDGGGGVFLRFGESGARIEDLALIAITHFHADHVADIPALVKSGYFSDRSAALKVSGPGAGGDYPSVGQFLRAEFDGKRGAFRYLQGALDGSEGLFKLVPVEVAPSANTPVVVLDSSAIRVSAVGVEHAAVPALGYRVEVAGFSVVFSGDQSGRSSAFWAMARNADLLVMDEAIPESDDPILRRLHAPPSAIGSGAAQAHVRRLVLSHLMARSLITLDANIAQIRKDFRGPIEVANDLACYPVGGAT
jgi:ribonuclease BN (tRNA processing enzyme)